MLHQTTNHRSLHWTLLLLLAFLITACAAPARPASQEPAGSTLPTQGTRLEPPREVADFTLTDQHNQPFHLSDLEGRLVLLYFGYTFCPDICPTSLAEFVHVKHQLGDQSDQLAVVMISVDGQRDSPERLNQYLANFHPDFIGLTGSEQEIRKVGVDYGIFFEIQDVAGTSADYLVDHTAAAYLLDGQRRLRVIYGYGTPPDVISEDVRALLAESEE